jgi:peptide/nickel transport system permease protein
VNREFVQAARLIGSPSHRILRKQILPNIVPPMLAYAVIVVATLIVAESSLSFLGLGIQPPTPSWGSMISDGQPNLADKPYLVFVPASFLFVTVYAFNILGDYVRRRLNPSRSTS